MANEKNQSPLQVKMPTQGWKQFLTARTRMLAAYDIAKEQESNRQVKTRHGLEFDLYAPYVVIKFDSKS